MIYFVEVAYTGTKSDKTYNYYSKVPLVVGEEVKVPLFGGRLKTAVVKAIYEVKEVVKGE